MTQSRRFLTNTTLALLMISAGFLIAGAINAAAAIVVNKSIAGIAIGDSRAQVIAAWGKPASSKTDLRKLGGSEGETILYFKKSKYGQDNVTLSGGRVVGISTYSTAQKTSQGIGPGSPYTTVAKTFPKAFSPLYGISFAVFPAIQVTPATAKTGRFTTELDGEDKYWSPVQGTTFTLVLGSKGGSTQSVTVGKWGPWCFWSFDCGLGG